MNRTLLASGFSITTFGEDEAGELYVANAGDGTIHRIEGSRAPRLSAAGVVNAASFAPGLSPGSLATAFTAGVLDKPGVVGADQLPLPATLQGVSITVDGIAAPIHSIANVNGQEQINFQVPFEITGRAAIPVVVARSGSASASAEVQVVDIQPAVYTVDGTNAVLVHNADYTLVSASRPLVPGEYAFLYSTGLGPVANQPATGAGAPAFPPAATRGAVRVTVAGLPCEVQYAGLAPELAGVYQVNFRVPSGAPAGSQELIVSAGAAASPPVRALVR